MMIKTGEKEIDDDHVFGYVKIGEWNEERRMKNEE